MQFLQYDFLYLFLSLIVLIFITPLSNLIGQKRSINFFYISSIFISSICIFFEHTSSYSINLSKLFLSFFSSFSLCIYILKFNKQKIVSEISKFNSFNQIMSILIIIIPIIFYAFLNFRISYNVIYLLIATIMIISFISQSYDKRR